MEDTGFDLECPECGSPMMIGTDEEGPSPNWGLNCSECSYHTPRFGTYIEAMNWMMNKVNPA